MSARGISCQAPLCSVMGVALSRHEDPISELVRETQDKRPLLLSESFGVNVSPASLVQVKSDFGLHLLAMHVPHDRV